MAAMNVYIDAHIGNVDAVKNNGAGGCVLHTVETAQKRALSASGRADDDNLFAVFDICRYPCQNIKVAKALFQVNYVYHFCAASFP